MTLNKYVLFHENQTKNARKMPLRAYGLQNGKDFLKRIVNYLRITEIKHKNTYLKTDMRILGAIGRGMCECVLLCNYVNLILSIANHNSLTQTLPLVC